MEARTRRGVATTAIIGLVVAMLVVLPSPVAAAPDSSAAPDAGVASDGRPSPSETTWAEAIEAARADGLTDVAIPDVSGLSETRAETPAVTTVARTVSADPDTDLVSGQEITATGSGFTGVPLAVVAQCGAGAIGPEDCDLVTIGIVEPEADGSFAVPFLVHRTVRADSGEVACAAAPGACVLIATDISGPAIDASTPLSFDPDAPAPAPELNVTPNTNLGDGQSVQVLGGGFPPNDLLLLAQCVPSPGCIPTGGTFVETDALGGAETSITVRVRAFTSAGELTNCVESACALDAFSLTNPDYGARVPLAFDPATPIPPDPFITVTPQTGLTHGQTVEVSGSGFDAGSAVEISECGPDSGLCLDYLGDGEIGPDGAFTASVPVTRIVTGFGIEGPVTDDCAQTTCNITASQYSEEEDVLPLAATRRISFRSTVPPPPIPTVEIDPATDVPFRADVAVHGTGFTPNAEVYADYCVFTEESGACGGFAFGQAAPDGTVDLSVSVQRIVRGFDDEELDCLDPGVECMVEVGGRFAFEQVAVPVGFDPDAPIPPPPTATVTPDEDLGWRHTVQVDGAGFAPGPVTVAQCTELTEEFEGEEFSFTLCFSEEQLIADASGDVSGSVTVRRKPEGLIPFPIDCATEESPCFLEIGDPFDPFGDLITVPLGFDPNSQPPPPPTLTVAPRSHLADGEVVAVRGAGFTPGTPLALAQCTAGAAAIADECDIAGSRLLIADAQGEFATVAAVRSVLPTPGGSIDCTASATCALAVANAGIASEFARSLLRFDAPELDLHGVTVTEGTGGTTRARVRMYLSEPNASPLTVDWRAVADTATPGVDSTRTRGRATIPAGSTSAVLPIDVVGDGMDEHTERFTVEVTAAPGTKVVDPDAVVTIADDDRRPFVGILDGRASEHDAVARAEVNLSAPSGKTVIVYYRTRHETARPGSDYITKERRLVFHPGETRHVVQIALVHDRIPEPTERFYVDIDAADHARILRDRATIRITDND